MAADNNQSLQAWTCIQCGAALPAEAGTGELVTCGYCGTPFKLSAPKARSGGVNISGGSVTIGGDLIGGSKMVMPPGAPHAAAIWDEPANSDDEGVSIDGDAIQIYGDVVGRHVVRIVPPVSAKPIAPEAPPASAPQLSWREKVKRLFSN